MQEQLTAFVLHLLAEIDFCARYIQVSLMMVCVLVAPAGCAKEWSTAQVHQAEDRVQGGSYPWELDGKEGGLLC